MDTHWSDGKAVLIALGKAQIDAMFKPQEDARTMIDDSEFFPLLEAVLVSYEATGLDAAGVEEIWHHAYSVYDRQCRQADASFTFEENQQLMQGYLVGPRGATRRKKKGRR